MSRNQPQPDPSLQDPLVASSCLDFLLIEMVPLAQRITEQLDAQQKALVEARQRSQIFTRPLPTRTKSTDGAPTESAQGKRDTTSAAHDSVAAAPVSVTGADLNGTSGLMDEETREATWFRLEQMGYRVGQGLVERFSAGKPRPQSPLDTIKFLCKDIWTLLYRKPIDNLKTNHRGIFVLSDTRFPPVQKISVDLRAGPKAREETLLRAQSYLIYPAGIVRGVLMGLGLECTVVAESAELPGARFEIRVKGAKP